MKRNKAYYIFSIIAMSVSLMIAILSTNILEKVELDWKSLSLTISAAVASFFAVGLSMLMTRRNKTNIYISYSPSESEVASKIQSVLSRENVLSSTTFAPSDRLNYSVGKNIHKSKVCFLIIGNHVTQFQKYEMKELRSQKKKVYVITTPDCANVPQSYRELIPISSEDNNFENKIFEIVQMEKIQ